MPAPAHLRTFALSFAAIAFTLVAAWYFVAETRLEALGMGPSDKPYWVFEAVTGIFLQSESGTEAKGFDYTTLDFGLINRTYPADRDDPSSESPPWIRLDKYIRHLNATSPDSVTYKLLYLARHGEGDHNVAEAYYGTKAWNEHWSKLDGNGTVSWSDAHLTDVGIGQARTANGFLKDQFSARQMPAPQVYYVSPLYRCLQTAQIEWDGIELPEAREFKPIIKELLREVIGVHTCDRRSSKSVISAAFPDWQIEPRLTEEDELWHADHRETHDENDVRTRTFLSDIFDTSPDAAYVSLTSHSGAIASHLRVVGHREFRLPTGGMMPVLVRGTRIS